MASVHVKILEPAENFGFMTPDEARLGMGMAAADLSLEYLEQMIAINSSLVATLCNRVFAKEKVRETWRCLGDPCDCPDGASHRRLYLSHFPVWEADVESVESGGNVISPGYYELEERSGVLTLWSTSEPIVVTYTGGYELPEEAPPALKYAAMLLVRSDQSSAQQQALAGVRMIAHKESRIVYHQATATEKAGTSAAGSTPALDSVRNLLSHFMRRWM